LASVQISEPQTSFPMDMAFRKRRFAPSRVAAGRFNFAYIHPHVAKQLAAKRAHGRAQVEDPIVGQERSCFFNDFTHVRVVIDFLYRLISRRGSKIEDRGSHSDKRHPPSSTPINSYDS